MTYVSDIYPWSAEDPYPGTDPCDPVYEGTYGWDDACGADNECGCDDGDFER